MRPNTSTSLLLFALLLLICGPAMAQNVGIGTNTPAASAKLDVNATDRGLLIPNVALVATTNGTSPVNTPATGLLVWNTNAAVINGSGIGYYYWDGTQWVRLSTSNEGWLINGNGNTNDNTSFVGTTDNNDLVLKRNNVEHLRLDNSVLTANDDNLDLDFQVKSVNDQNAIRVDAFNNRVGILTGTPNEALDVHGNVELYDGAPQLNIVPTLEQDGKIRFEDAQATTTQNFEIAFNASDQDLHIRADDNGAADIIRIEHEGNVEMAQGWLSVGGTTGSVTRYGVDEFDWQGTISFDANGYQYYDLGTWTPPVTNTITITKIFWEVDGYHEDANEIHGVWMKFGTGTGGTWYGWQGNASNGAKDINWHYMSAPLTVNLTGGQNIRLRVEDDDCTFCGNDDMRVFNITMRFFYQYNTALTQGDIAASGRIFANSTEDVGDMAEYFPVMEAGLDPGKIVVLKPGTDNEYALAKEPYSQHIVGVISQNPSIVLNNPAKGAPVALAGRVKVDVLPGQQPIQSGDFLTTSHTPGVAMKATRPGPVIGYAVANQKPGEKQVEILVQPGRFYYPTEADDQQDTENARTGKPYGRRMD